MKYLLCTLLIVSFNSYGQFGNVTLPDVSQKASVSQTVGLTDIIIEYNRPGVKGRELWGTNLVPYNNKPRPWRAGADDNTTFSFSSDVTVGGKSIPKGTYGFHIIPSEDEWTLIFSSNSTSWGSFHYTEEEDVARTKVTPRENDHTEWLLYSFTDVGENYAVVTLAWEKLAIDFKIEVDVHTVVLTSIRKELRNLKGYDWQGYQSAAAYCLASDINYEEALQWIDRSIEMKRRSINLFTKSQLLTKLERHSESEEVLAAALELADEGETNFFGWQFWKDFNKPEKALEIFEMNIKATDNWTAHYLSAQVYETLDNQKLALKHARYCLETADNESRKDTARNLLAGLEGK